MSGNILQKCLSPYFYLQPLNEMLSGCNFNSNFIVVTTLLLMSSLQ